MLPWQPILGFYIWEWGAHWRHLKNTTEPSMCGGDAALCQITLTTCYFIVVDNDVELLLGHVTVIQIESSMHSSVAAFCRITVTTCYVRADKG